MESFSDKLKAGRERAGLTQEQLAQKLDVTSGTVAAWEQGRQEPMKHTAPLILAKVKALSK